MPLKLCGYNFLACEKSVSADFLIPYFGFLLYTVTLDKTMYSALAIQPGSVKSLPIHFLLHCSFILPVLHILASFKVFFLYTI